MRIRPENCRGFYLLAAAASLLHTTVADAEGPPIGVAEAETRQIVEVLRVSGTVTSPQTAVLSPSVAGLVASVMVDAGDRVETGDVIVTLDRELEELALERAVAEASEARTALEDARRRLAEAERVGPTRGIAESEIRSLRAEAAQGEATLEAVEAAVRQQEAVLRRHSVKAPFSGVVSQRITEVGEWVNPGDGLVELVATEGLRFDFRVPQAYFGRIGGDTAARLSVDAAPEQSVPGEIQAIVPVKEPGARTFLLRIIAANGADTAVTPGMSARAELRIATGREGVVVPRDALLRYPDGRQTVWSVHREDGEMKVHEQRVETGVEFDGVVELRSGLATGTTVVTRGNEVLRDGQSVTIP